jgi:hypothetical protein
LPANVLLTILASRPAAGQPPAIAAIIRTHNLARLTEADATRLDGRRAPYRVEPETNGLVGAPGTRHPVKRCPSNGRLLENKTER